MEYLPIPITKYMGEPAGLPLPLMDPPSHQMVGGKDPWPNLIMKAAQKEEASLCPEQEKAYMGSFHPNSSGAGQEKLQARLHVVSEMAQDYYKAKEAMAQTGVPVPGQAWGVRRYRKHPGMKALCEIRFYQKSVMLLMDIGPFCQLVKEVTEDLRNDLRWQAAAIYTLQNASEACLVCLQEDTNLCMIHTKQHMIIPRTYN